ncbi:MAG: S1/P1 Nuclease [Cytophagales bacterium]|nr:S1/P1 Nuclease [Cytophagales bacterium]
MKRIFLLLLLYGDILSCGFGFFTHEQVNYNAVFTFPEGDLFNFYKKHISYFSKHAADPDKRKFTIRSEGEKHFFNIDAKEYDTDIINSPWIPYKKMCQQYGEKTVKQYGLLPWSILASQKLLTEAFESKNSKKILQHSIDLAHYIADSCTPLHTTKNYNGQETDQVGIHSLWETLLPKLFFKSYDLNNIKAQYQKNLPSVIWENIKNSYNEALLVLEKDRELNAEILIGKYAYMKMGKTINRTYSKKYARLYHTKLDGQLERQIRKTIKMIGDFIYTSWVDAGKPSLL